MTNIDFSQIITAEMKRESERAAHRANLKAECQERISAALDLITLSNIQSAILAGELDKTQEAAFAAAREWINGMRTACHEATASDEITPASWPPLPEGVEELASQF